MKLCNVCNTVHNTDSWLSLPLCARGGRQDFGFSVLEMRNCTCGTTLALELPLTFVLKYAEGREEFSDVDEANERAAYLGGDCIMSRIVSEPEWCGCAAFGPFVSECGVCGA